MDIIKRIDRPLRYGGGEPDGTTSEELPEFRVPTIKRSVQLTFPIRDMKRHEIRELAGILSYLGQTVSIMSYEHTLGHLGNLCLASFSPVNLMSAYDPKRT